MKKYFLSLISFLFVCGTASAQYTPEAGDVSTEITVSKLFEDPQFNLNNNSLRVRYFMSDEIAVRASLSLGVNANKDYVADKEDDFKDKNFGKNRASSLGIAVGLERHYNIGDRMSAYYGGEFTFGRTGTKNVSSSDADGEYYTQKKHSTNLGLAAVTGLDFYVYSKLYVGAELGLSYSLSKAGKSVVKDKLNGDGGEVTYKDPDTNVRFGLFCTPAVRLGWVF